jgi:intraflagellar transport protein 140
VQQLCWHGGQGTVAAVTDDGVVVLTETIMHCKQCGELSVVQTGSHELSLNVGGSQEHWTEQTGMLVKGLTVGLTCFAIWGGKSARVYRVDGILSNVEPLEPFTTAGTALAITDTSNNIIEEALFIAEDGMVKICNFQGVQKGSITFSETEGSPEHLDINGQYLAIITNKGFIKILDITKPKSPKNAGQSGNAGRFSELVSNGQSSSNYSSNNTQSTQVRCIKVNSKGNRVAILADHVEGSLQVRHPDSNLYVYDHDRGNVNSFDFSVMKRRPISIFWDDRDDRMLSCEAQKNRVTAVLPGAADMKLGGELSKNLQEDKDADDKELSEVEVVIFFATKENGLLMQDSFPRKAPFGNMLGFIVPRLYFRDAPISNNGEENESKGGEVSTNKAKVYSKVMRDFIGVEDISDQVKTALLDFSYNLTLGKLDEAYRAVKTIGSVTIWENMAQMCVKTKRLDVAEVCLGNMGHARGAAAVREAKKEGSLETSVGVLAIQLGLYDDAARLFREAGRYDLLNRLFQSAGLWEKAINIATSTDRIHLKTTHYHYAKHLESIGDISNAITHFEKSDTSRTEVPRMLFSLQRIDDLEDYIHKSDDVALLKWWAAYLESNERYDKARKYYSKAGDFLSLVRIACFKGDLNKAAEIVQEAGDKAAAYHFARQLENQGEYQEAINFYAQSGCFNHSIRLARCYNLDSELMKFALKSTSSLMLDCASHFEEKGELEKAVELYHKGGDLPRALDLCFRAGEDKTGKSSKYLLIIKFKSLS